MSLWNELKQWAVPATHGEIDAILKKSEEDIKSGKCDPEKDGMSVEEYKRRRREAWRRTE